MFSRSKRKSTFKSIIIAAFMSYYIILNQHVSSQTIILLSTSEQDQSGEETGQCNELENVDCHCGPIAKSPGIALNTRTIYPNSSTIIEEYNENLQFEYNKKVFYRCSDDKNNVLVGNSVRECLKGHWTGSVPRCAINLLNQTKLTKLKIIDLERNRLNSSKTENVNQTQKPISMTTLYYDATLEEELNGAFEIPLKNQPKECLRWNLSLKQIWSLSLNKPTRIHYVRIKLYCEQINHLHHNNQISFQMILKNITYNDNKELKYNQPQPIGLTKLPIEIKCTTQSNVDLYEQKQNSSNYIVLVFLCEMPKQTQKSKVFFAHDYEIDQLYANVIEVHFEMMDLYQNFGIINETTSNNSNQTDKIHEFQKKKSLSISLCELKLYTFSSDCGTPDMPNNAIVQRIDDEVTNRKAYKYACNDVNDADTKYILKGNEYVECGSFGKWKNKFPQCISINPCQLLNTTTTIDEDYTLNVKYEKVDQTKSDEQATLIPSEKYARISCEKIKQDNQTIDQSQNLTLSVNETKSTPKVIYQISCINGKWIGLQELHSRCKESVNEISNNKQTNETITMDNYNLVTLSVGIIRTMFGALVVLFLIIVSMCICLVFRCSRNKKEAIERKEEFNHESVDHEYAEINYDLPYSSSVKHYLDLYDGECEDIDAQYETAWTNNIHDEIEEISEFDNHTYYHK